MRQSRDSSLGRYRVLTLQGRDPQLADRYRERTRGDDRERREAEGMENWKEQL